MANAETNTGFQRGKRGPGVYDFVKGLILEGEDAKFMDNNGRYWINWLTAPRLYHKFRAKKNPKLSSECDPKDARKTLYGALIYSYKDDGAKEYEQFKEFKKGGQVTERQFQMPSKIFESLFRKDYTSGFWSAEGTDGVSSEESMDCVDSAVDPTSSDSEVVETICPSSGPTKGGISVLITLGRKLPRGVKSGICEFVQVGVSIQWEKINSKTIKLTVPAAKKPGAVVLRVTTETNEFLGETIFVFVDEGREAMETLIENPKSFSENSDLMPSLLRGFSKLVKDPSMQKTFFHMMYSQDGGMSENNSTVAENLTQDSTIQANYSQALEVLLRLVYIAVEEDAHQFIEMIYSTSAGKILVGSYNNELPLPEDVARAKGHFKLAEYLQAVNIRFSSKNGSDVQSKSIDWHELFQAVDRMQTQPSESGDERDFGGMPSLEDSNLSDYFADVETSSCGSFEVDSEWAVSEVPNDKKESSRMQSKDDNQSVSFADAETSPCDSLELISDWSDLEEKSGARTKGEDCEKAAMETGNDDSASLLHDRPLGISMGFLKENATEESFEDKTQLDSDQDSIESPSIYGKFSVVNFPVYRKLPLLHGFVQWLSRKEGDLSAEQQEKCSHLAEEMGSVSQKKGTQRKDYKSPGQKCATSESSCQEKTTKSKKHRQRGHRRFKTTFRMEYILLTAALVTVLVELKLGVELWTKQMGLTTSSASLLFPPPSKPSASTKSQNESQIPYRAVGNGYTHFSKLLLKCGLNVDAPNFRMGSLLHVAAKCGFGDLADVLTKLGSNVNAKTYQQQTPLHFAVWNGHEQIAAMLLERGGDAQSGDVFGRTPVHLAVVQGRERMLEMLIQHGSALKARDDLGRSPLHLASLEGNERSVELLIRHGCEINARDNSQKTALHLAAESGQDTIVHSLIMRGADIQATDVRGQTPLNLAVGNGHYQIAAMLLQHGSDTQRVDGFGRTPVHLAAVQGRERMLEMLIQHGCDLKARDYLGRTPLYSASFEGNERSVELLIQQGCDISARDNSQKTALHLAAESGQDTIVLSLLMREADIEATDLLGQTPLHFVVWNGHQKIATMLLQCGSDAQRGDRFGCSSVHLAPVQGRERTLEIFIQHDCDLKARDDLGRTPLHLASLEGNERSVELLIGHGCDISARDNYQKTALHLAAESKEDTVVHFLIMGGADIQTTALRGQTPLHLAAQNGSINVVKLLLEHGSIVGTVNVFRQTPLHLAVARLLWHLLYIGLDCDGESDNHDVWRKDSEHLATSLEFLTITRLLDGNRNEGQQILEIYSNVLKSMPCNKSDLKVPTNVKQITLHLTSILYHAFGTSTRVQIVCYPVFISGLLFFARCRFVLVTSQEFDEYKYGIPTNALSFSHSFHLTMPCNTIENTLNDSCVCAPHNWQRYARLELIRQERHYHKLDSYLEYFGRSVLSLSRHYFCRDDICRGCLVAGEETGKLKRTREDKYLYFAEDRLLYYPCGYHFELGRDHVKAFYSHPKPQSLFSSQWSQLEFFKQQMKENGYSETDVGHCSAENEDIQQGRHDRRKNRLYNESNESGYGVRTFHHKRYALTVNKYSSFGKSFIHREGNSLSGPKRYIDQAVRNPTKGRGVLDAQVVEQCSTESKDMQPYENNSQKGRACESNVFKVWTLTSKNRHALKRESALDFEINIVKHLQISFDFKIVILFTLVVIIVTYECDLLVVCDFLVGLWTKQMGLTTSSASLLFPPPSKPSASTKSQNDIRECEPIEQELCVQDTRQTMQDHRKKIKRSEKRI